MMDCNEFSNLLDAYLDGELRDAEANRLKEHAESCPQCATLLQVCRDARGLDEELEVPAAFSSAWREKIREEEKMENKTRKRAAWRTWVAAAAALAVLLGSTALVRIRRSPDENYPDSWGRSGVSYSAVGSVPNVAYDSDMPAAKQRSAGGAILNEAAPMMAPAEDETGEADQPQKIIRTASFTLKTTAFEETLAGLNALTTRYGGRVAYLYRYGDAESGEARTATLTLRVPAERLDDFLAGAGEVGRVTSLTQERRDVTESYYDTQSRLETQQAKMERLRALMESAQNVSDLIEIENAVADTQYTIDSYTGRLKNYDNQVEESTVRVTLQEVRVAQSEDAGLGRRIVEGLKDSLTEGWEFFRDMLVAVLALLPWLIVVGVVVLVVVKIRKNHQKRSEEK